MPSQVSLQAFGVARQMLSLVAGSAIDEYLLSQMRLLRQPITLARMIHAVQTKLWPGGTWFQHSDAYLKQHPVSCMALHACVLCKLAVLLHLPIYGQAKTWALMFDQSSSNAGSKADLSAITM